jgi:hypothetical protein
VQGCFFPTPQPENEASQVAAVAPQVIVSGPSRAANNVKKIPRRDKKLSIKEDELLCSAYINVSKDPIAGCSVLPCPQDDADRAYQT